MNRGENKWGEGIEETKMRGRERVRESARRERENPSSQTFEFF